MRGDSSGIRSYLTVSSYYREHHTVESVILNTTVHCVIQQYIKPRVIICFDSTRETKEKLDRLLQTGEYADYGEAISFAVDNALMLQEEVQRSGSVVIEASSTDDVSNSPLRRNPGDKSKQDFSEEESQSTGEHEESENIPGVFRRPQPSNSLPLADLPSDMWMSGQEIPLDRWVFGQYNKLLPAKASCRALAALADSDVRGVALDDAKQYISEAAVKLGDFLEEHDESNGLKRDNALATAFPTSGNGQEKSRRRYANQFVAKTNKHDQLMGLLFDLKLINRADKKEFCLLLTRPGWEFARMQNPILDGLQEKPTQKFSDSERRFLLDHISHSVPVEDYAYRTILDIISEGINAPSEIDAALRDRISISKAKKGQLTDSFLSSQRSGAASRMEDLGLIERVRNGIRISYAITELGQQYPPSEN